MFSNSIGKANLLKLLDLYGGNYLVNDGRGESGLDKMDGTLIARLNKSICEQNTLKGKIQSYSSIVFIGDYTNWCFESENPCHLLL